MMQKPKAVGKKNSQHVEGLVNKIEKNGTIVEDEVLQGDKRRREGGNTPEDQKRVSKVAMCKISGGSKIAQPTQL